MNKITFRKRKRVSKFYFKLINNLLSDNYFVSKKNKTPGNVQISIEKVEKSYHNIFECLNVQHTCKIIVLFLMLNGNT